MSIVKPNASGITPAVAAVAAVAAPFIPAKIRAVIYSIAGTVSVIALALSPVLGGTVGVVLGIVGAAAAAVTTATALSHIGK